MDTSVPPPDPTPQERAVIHAARMARVDGCPICVTNYETPSSVYDAPEAAGGFLANYVCQSCGYAWTTSWGDN